MRISSLALAACLGVCCSASAADFSAFEKVSTLSFTEYTGSALVNFPVLVRVSENIDGFRYSDMSFPATGADLRFSDMAGGELAYEIDTRACNLVLTGLQARGRETRVSGPFSCRCQGRNEVMPDLVIQDNKKGRTLRPAFFVVD